MDLVFISRIIVYFIFGSIQAVSLFFVLNLLKDKANVDSFKVLIKGLIVFFSGLVLSAILSFFYRIKFMSVLSVVPALIASVVLIFFLVKYKKLHAKELQRQKEIEAEALRIAEISNIADETFLRAKNLLPIGNDFLVLTANAVRKKVERQQIFDFINEKLISEAFADGGIVLTLDDFEDEILVQSLNGIFPPPYKLPDDVPHKENRVHTNMKHAIFKMDENIFGQIAMTGQPILIEDGSKDERIFSNGDEYFLEVGSYLFLPLIYNGVVNGVIGLSRNKHSPAFNDSDVEICSMLASYASTAIHVVTSLEEESVKDTIANEIELATRIQKMLLPKKLIPYAEIDSAVYFKPAKGICSDYYDIIRTGQNKFFCIMLDVAGKSMQASIIMIMIRTLLYLTTNTAESISTIMNWINKGVTNKIDIDHFAGLALVNYNPQTHKIIYSGAGNMSMGIFQVKKGTFKQFSQNTDAIGIDINSAYTEVDCDIEPGDIILMYTDGVIEALNKNGDSFTLKNLYKTIKDNAEKSSKEIVKAFTSIMEEFLGDNKLHDDQSLMVIKVK